MDVIIGRHRAKGTLADAGRDIVARAPVVKTGRSGPHLQVKRTAAA